MSAPAVRTRPSRMRPFILGELFLVAFLLFGYDRIASVANSHAREAVRHAWALVRAERFLHVSVEQSLNHLLAPHRLLDQVLAVYYDFAHGIVTFGALLALYVFSAPLYRPARSALMLINGAALAIFLLLPVAPPRLLSGAGFIDVVANSHTWGAWEAGNSSLAEHADKFASVPSLHVAWAVWVLRMVFTASASRLLRTLASVHVVITVGVVVATGNHYVADVVAGAALAEAAWWATRGASLSLGALRRAAVPPAPCRPANRRDRRQPALTGAMAESRGTD